MPSIQQLFAKAQGILPWSIPIKLMLSALLGILGSAGLLGYISEYATYSYAIHYGFRPPLEGIPYLRPAVAFGSLFLLSTGAILFASIAFILRSFVWYFDAIPRVTSLILRRSKLGANGHQPQMGKLLTALREGTWWQHLGIATLVATTLGASTVLLIGFTHPEAKHSLFNFGLLVFIAVYFIAIVLAILRPTTIWWAAIIGTISYFIVCVYLLFTPDTYSQFLRILGYGGGLSVRLELRDANDDVNSNPPIQQLMLRTTEAIILYDASREAYSEIPRDQVRRIIHNTGGLRQLNYLLPAKVEK